MGKYSTTNSVEITVKGGFPVIAKGTVCFPDHSVGLNGYWVEDAELLTLKNKPCPFMERKMTEDDWAKVEEQLIEDYCAHGRFE